MDDNRLPLEENVGSPKQASTQNSGYGYTGNCSMNRASDLLMAVSLFSHYNQAKITDLAYTGMHELTKMALTNEPLWLPHENGGNEILNPTEYMREFGHVDATLMDLIKMVEVGEPQSSLNYEIFGVEDNENTGKDNVPENDLQSEASRGFAVLRMSTMELVALFMDLERWSAVFCNIVSRATVLGVFSTGSAQGNYDGALQVMSAEFHVSTPLVPSRESYFARYCRQLSHDIWGVVDVSLEKMLSCPSIKFRRRPSGCLIQDLSNEMSKVIWVEHVEANQRWLPADFQLLVTSGFAFGAKRWLASLTRQIEWSETLKAESTSTDEDVLIPQAGRTSLLKLAERMMRNFCIDVSGATSNTWMQLPVSGAENVRVMTKNNFSDPGKPPGVTIAFATSLWLPVSPTQVFDFLRDEKSRTKWDILSRGHFIQEIAYIINGTDSRNRVSILQVNAARKKIEILYLQQSYTNSTGSYVVYAPIDFHAMSALLGGGDPKRLAILPSGFAILPDCSISKRGDDPGGTLLTIAFHIIDSASTGDCVPAESVLTVHKIMSETVVSIKAAVLNNNVH